MKSQIASVAMAAIVALAITGCGSQAASSAAASASSSSAETTSSITASNDTAASESANADAFGAVANTIAQDEEALVSEYASKFEQVEYTDAETGLTVTYNLFLPENYDAAKDYPLVVFIADSSCAGTDAARSLTQGLGALVWASDEWQAANECIVCVPTYPETILDDRSGYTTTEYVELTKRLIETVSSEYAVDANRIYGTGQSMGCMTTLILASEYPDLYAACMFVDGQWDVSTLSGLENQTFVYFAAEDDTSAFNGMSEVMALFDADGTTYTYEQWDGTWNCDELSAAADNLFSSGTDANFISWKTGTIDSSSASGSMGSMAGGSGGRMSGGTSGGGMGNASGGGMGSVGYHMASFDYAYNCIAVMEWLFQQTK